MSRVGEDRAVLHLQHVVYGDRPRAAGRGDKNIAERRGVFHLHHAVAVHARFDGLDRIDFGDDDLRTECRRAHRDAARAPAVADNHDGLGRHDQIRIAHDAVPGGLSGPVTVVEQMLAVRVIDRHHREFEHAVRCHRLETDNAAGRFLAAAPDFLRQLRTLFVNAADQIGAVIDDDVRLVFQRHLDVTGIFFGCGRVIRVYPQTVLRQRRRDLVLRAEWIGAGDGHLRAACRQHLAQIGGLGFQMHR